MNTGRSVFAQLLGFVPFKHFEYLAGKFGSNHGIHSFSAWSHFVVMSYAQLTLRDGLRDLVACLNSQHSKLYHVGVRHRLSRSTLADAAERRDWTCLCSCSCNSSRSTCLRKCNSRIWSPTPL